MAEELDARRAAVRPEDPFTFIYTSGTTGPPKGCVLTHGNYRAIVDMIGEAGEITDDEVIYLYLPLAHSFALLIQLAVFDLGGTLAYFGGDTKQIVPELMEVKPTYLPSVPRVFEKIYTLAHGAIEAKPPEERKRAQEAIKLGVKVRDMINRGEPVPEELQKPFDEADAELFKNVRAIFGGDVRHATSGAAPIAKEILEFFWACGVPVLEGYGMTETAPPRRLDGREPPLRHRRARAAGSRAEDRRRRRDPDQRPEHLRGLPQPGRRELRRGRGRLAAHRRPRLARRGRLPLDHRAQEGHHHHRRRQEPDAREHRERPQAVPLDLPGGDARRPAPLPGRADHARRGRDPVYASEHDLPRTSHARSRTAQRARADPAGDRPRQRQIRAGRAGQEVRDPRPRPLAGDGRADADAEGQAQRRQREVRRPVRLALCQLTVFSSARVAANIGSDAHRSIR
jgi:acyl-CoA synthetase (AMP-forming)/AMP-acid ligase II